MNPQSERQHTTEIEIQATPDPTRAGWAEFRQALKRVLERPNTNNVAENSR